MEQIAEISFGVILHADRSFLPRELLTIGTPRAQFEISEAAEAVPGREDGVQDRGGSRWGM